MTEQLTDELREFLQRPNPCVMATLAPHGGPVTVATWYLLDGDEILFSMDAGRRRLEHIRRDPRVSCTMLAVDEPPSGQPSWHTHVSIRGRVVRLRDDADFADIDKLCNQFLGKPYTNRTCPRVSAWLAIDNIHGWGRFGK